MASINSTDPMTQLAHGAPEGAGEEDAGQVQFTIDAANISAAQ